MDAEEIMPNIEYDRMYDELLDLEKETGIILSNSPTQNVGYEIVSDLPKERHPSRMLSLDKTKSREELRDWLGDQEGLLSWKLDGLTIVLTYDDGKLVKALTRGNGDVGEVVTNNAKVFANVPVSIAFKGHLVLRGEAVIKYSDFERINETIGDADAKYKNPRNLCSGSVRQLDPRVTKARNVNFIAFTLVEAEGVDFHELRGEPAELAVRSGL
jgi:DNA ligase (NAD+)